MTMKMTRRVVMAAAAATLAFTNPAVADGHQVMDEINFLIPGGAGGGWDGTARGVGEALTNSGLIGTASLLVYVLGFSLAYATLEAGVGALILFGVVQLTMFMAAALTREHIPALQYVGCGVAFAGLVALLWPVGAEAPDLWGAILMAAAGVGWGVYTLVGRGAASPLLRTERNFRYAALFMGVVAIGIGLPVGAPLGLMCAVASGALTSALGYALWYRVLPQLRTTIAATAQLTVPVIALGGGALFLGEELTLRFALSSLLVLGGVGLALRKAR